MNGGNNPYGGALTRQQARAQNRQLEEVGPRQYLRTPRLPDSRRAIDEYLSSPRLQTDDEIFADREPPDIDNPRDIYTAPPEPEDFYDFNHPQPNYAYYPELETIHENQPPSDNEEPIAHEPEGQNNVLHPNMEEVHSDQVDEENGTLVAEDATTGLKVYVVRTKMSRHWKFRLQNHLYRFHIVKPPGFRYSLESVSETLQRAVANAIRMVQRGYNEARDKFAQLFIVLRDQGPARKGHEHLYGEAHTYNSGHYDLWQPAASMAEEIMEKITTYFQSNKEFRLAHGLYFSMTVVHYKSAQARKLQPNYRPPKTAKVGASPRSDKKETGFPDALRNYKLKRDSVTTYTMPNEFIPLEWCLVAAMLFGCCRAMQCAYAYLGRVMRKRTLTEDEQNQRDTLFTCPYRLLYWQIVRLTVAEGDDVRLNAIREVKLKLYERWIISLLEHAGLEKKGPYSFTTDGAKFADALGIQYYVYARIGHKKIFEYPNDRDISRPSILLYFEEYRTSATGHITLLFSPTFFSYSYDCPYCNRRVTHNQARHMCRNSCIACRGYRHTNEPKAFHSSESPGYCDLRNVKQDEFQRCPKCNAVSLTKECGVRHAKSSSCARGFACEKCGKYERKHKGMKTIDEFRRKHNCSEVQCNICYEKYLEGEDKNPHLCRVRPMKAQTYYPNLAFFDTETVATSLSSESCRVCIRKELNFLHEQKLEGCTRSELFEIANDTAKVHEIRCPKHEKTLTGRDFHYVNALSFYFEDGEHGNFSRMGFFDPALNISKDLIKENDVLTMSYLPEGVSTTLQTAAVRRRGKFSRGMKQDVLGGLGTLPPPPTELCERDHNIANQDDFIDDGSIDGEDAPRVSLGTTHIPPTVASFFSLEAEEVGEEGEEREGEYIPLRKATEITNVDGESFTAQAHHLRRYMPVVKFLVYLLRPQFRNYVILSHNGQGFDHQLIVETAYNMGLTPEILTRGQKLMSVTFTDYNIRFLDFMLYKGGSLAELAERAKLSVSKMDFPYQFNLPENYAYKGQLPPNTYFGRTYEEDSSRDERNILLDAERSKCGDNWCFKDELQKYVHMDVEILARLALTFARECFSFQEICSNYFEDKWRNKETTKIMLQNDPNAKYHNFEYPLLHPYGFPFLTLSGYVFGSWRYYDLVNYELYSIPDERGSNTINTSKQEHEWISWLEAGLGDNIDINSAYTSRRAPSIGVVRPDYYIPQLQVAGFFHGCAVHGHFDKLGKPCHLISTCTPLSTNMWKDTYKFIAARDRRHNEILLDSGIKQINIMYECEWQRLSAGKDLKDEADKMKSESIRSFLTEHYKNRPLHRLATRVALRGGKVECYDTTFIADEEPGRKLSLVDYNSLYPSVCSTKENVFPTGKPENIIRGKDIKRVRITSKGAWFKDKPILGVAHVRVEIKPCMNPFLTYRSRGKSIAGICRKCVEEGSLVPCDCPTEEKSFVSVWTLAELSKAVELGDKIIDIFEVVAYTSSAPVLKEFLDILSSYKIRHTKFQETDKVKLQAICDKINADMHFTNPGLLLTPELLEEDEGAKTFFKLWANSLLGKFSQDNDKLQYKIVSCQTQLDALLNSDDLEVEELLEIGGIIQVGIRKRESHIQPNITAQVVIGSYVTAYARMEMQSHFERLLADKDVALLYTDTDSAMLKTLDDVEPDLTMGNSYREWKNELPNSVIKKYHCLGPKSYAYTYIEDGTQHEVVKCKGFALRGNKELSSEHIQAMTEGRAEDPPRSLKRSIPQFRIAIDKKRRALYNTHFLKTLSPDIMSKRVLVGGTTKTFPFGYSQGMLETVLNEEKIRLDEYSTLMEQIDNEL